MLSLRNHADRGAAQTNMSTDLSKSVPMNPHRCIDTLIPLLPARQLALAEQLGQARPCHKPLAIPNTRPVARIGDEGPESLDVAVRAKDPATSKRFPDSGSPALADESAILHDRLLRLGAELT